jgi:hypothetical protein
MTENTLQKRRLCRGHRPLTTRTPVEASLPLLRTLTRGCTPRKPRPPATHTPYKSANHSRCIADRFPPYYRVSLPATTHCRSPIFTPHQPRPPAHDHLATHTVAHASSKKFLERTPSTERRSVLSHSPFVHTLPHQFHVPHGHDHSVDTAPVTQSSCTSDVPPPLHPPNCNYQRTTTTRRCTDLPPQAPSPPYLTTSRRTPSKCIKHTYT